MGPFRILLIYHPDAIEELLVTRNRDFIKSPGVRLLRPLLGDGLLLSEGQTWLRQRRLMQPAFHRQRIAGYGDVMSAFTERHIAGWQVGATVDVHAEMIALSWAWYLLAQHPDADAQLAEEVRDVLGGRAPAVADLPRLKYAEMVIMESLRLYPPAYGLGRQATTASEIGGQRVGRGDIFIVPTWVIHRDRR